MSTQAEDKLSLEEVAEKIKGLISRSALAKIEIGDLLNKYTAEIEHGGKEEFYKSISMSPRTAQHYMRIASNEEVQKLRAEDKLDGLNMSQILAMVGMRVNIRGVNNDITPAEYKPVENFNYDKCRSTRIFKIEYEALTGKVTELEAELETFRSKTA